MKTIARTLTVITLALAGGVGIGWYAATGGLISMESGMAGDTADTTDAEAKQPVYWVAPMDSNYRRDQPGKSPMGMDLIPVYDNSKDDTGALKDAVMITPQVENNLGVRTATVTRAALTLEIKAAGFVAVAADRIHHIHSRVEGWIGALAVTSRGDRVTKGQLLFELYSPELVNAQQELLSAQRIGSRTLKSAAREKLLAYGVSDKQIQALAKRKSALQYLPFHADRAGYVGELNVRHGMFVSQQKEMLSIYALDSVWVIAEIFERQAGWVKTGQRVTLQAQAYPERSFEGRIDYIYPELDSKTRSLQARIEIPNPDGLLRPNMLVSASISATTISDALTVPHESVIKTASMNRVVKSLGDGRYQSVAVQTGREAGRQVEILDGLKAGDSVVTSAQFLIDSESNIDAELARMQSTDSAEHEHRAKQADSVKPVHPAKQADSKERTLPAEQIDSKKPAQLAQKTGSAEFTDPITHARLHQNGPKHSGEKQTAEPADSKKQALPVEQIDSEKPAEASQKTHSSEFTDPIKHGKLHQDAHKNSGEQQK